MHGFYLGYSSTKSKTSFGHDMMHGVLDWKLSMKKKLKSFLSPNKYFSDFVKKNFFLLSKRMQK